MRRGFGASCSLYARAAPAVTSVAASARGSPHELARPGRLHRRREGGDVVGAVVAEVVDEERRGARHAGEIRGVDVLRDPARADARPQVVLEALDVEPELPGVADELAIAQRVLVLEQ